jgi:hypothetical protein
VQKNILSWFLVNGDFNLKSHQEMYERFAVGLAHCYDMSHGLWQCIPNFALCGFSSALAQTAWGLEKMKCHQIGHKNPHFLSHR